MILNFYKVLPDFFDLGKKYSFDIFLYDPMRSQRFVEIYATTELTQEHFDKWIELLGKGVYLQIHFKDKDSFFSEAFKTYDDLVSANPTYYKMLDLQESRLAKYEEESKKTFLLRTVLNDISKSNDYTILIERVRSEIMCMPLHKSDTVSICTEIVEKLFNRDILPVKMAALSYMLAKQNKISDIELLCSVVIASLVQNIGFGLINSTFFANYKELEKEDIYSKHPMLTIYILSKTGFEFDKNTKRLILEHHEQADGSGFPREKKEDHISYLSFIINLSDQMLMYSGGYINGRKTNLIKTIELFHKQVGTEGVNMSFPMRLTDSLGVFLLNDLEKELEP
jgi:HD-GYP domain-containing protein (c-di-GMP phosphodiesterase class II)